MTRAAILVTCMALLITTPVAAQRYGGLPGGSITAHFLLSDGPAGPIHGGESAVTDMLLMPDSHVYGSTGATGGAPACHLFRTDGVSKEHILAVTERFPGQTSVTDLAHGSAGTFFGVTSSTDEVFDGSDAAYEGGHVFSYDTADGTVTDHGVAARGQGLTCVAVDTLRKRVYCVSYPAGHLLALRTDTGDVTDYGEVMKPWRVMHLGRVFWRGVPRVLMLDDAGTLYFSTYDKDYGGRIYRLAPDAEAPVFTGATVPTQRGMDNDPLYENTITCAVRAKDGGFWCGTSVDGFLFKFLPSTSTVINKGKAFNYWELGSMAWGGDGRLYMLGGRDYDNPWLMCYDPATGSIDSLGWPSNYSQCGTICATAAGDIIIAENMRNSYLWVFGASR